MSSGFTLEFLVFQGAYFFKDAMRNYIFPLFLSLCLLPLFNLIYRILEIADALRLNLPLFSKDKKMTRLAEKLGARVIT